MTRSGISRLTIGAVLPLAVAGALLTAPTALAETTYTLAEVQKHATPADCWSAVNGSVYDLTAWINRHEGGATVIKALCGIDGSASFNGAHGRGGDDDENEPAQALARYRIGAYDASSAAAAAAAAASTTLTLADVSKHATAADCWTVVSGSVYNLSTWGARHPGGAGVITAMCGIDATTSYLGKHQGSGGAASALSQFKIGTVGAGTAATLSTTPPTTTPSTTTPSTTPATSKSYTIQQVRRHKGARNCWSVVNKRVYNLSAWIARHPGGASTITSMCGRNASKSFNAQHGGAAKAARALQRYQIGTLSAARPAPAVAAPPAPVTPASPAASTQYTLAQVSTHNSATNCWSVVSATVYDLTAWISRHPGGQSTIKGMCGIDATAAFLRQHQNSSSAKDALGGYAIGTLV